MYDLYPEFWRTLPSTTHVELAPQTHPLPGELHTLGETELHFLMSTYFKSIAVLAHSLTSVSLERIDWLGQIYSGKNYLKSAMLEYFD